jgi:hypothetical protein
MAGISSTTFAKPDLDRLSNEGLFAADLHFHPALGKGGITEKTLFGKLQKSGLHLAVTCHNDSIKEAVKLSRSPLNTDLIIPGIEICTREGIHTILYFSSSSDLEEFYARKIRKNLTGPSKTNLMIYLDDALDFSASYNCVSCSPHPFGYLNRRFHSMIRELLSKKKFGCIETINSCIPHYMNWRSASFSETLPLAITAGTDGRTLQELGNAVTVAEASTIEEFLESLRKKKTYSLGTESSFKQMIANVASRPEMKPGFWPFYLANKVRIMSQVSRKYINPRL